MRIPLAVFSIFLFGMLFWSCDSEGGIKEQSTDWALTSDLEETVMGEEKEMFQTSDPKITLDGVVGRTDEVARSGTYAIKLDTHVIYGLNCHFDDIRIGEFFEISVWIHKNSKDASLQAVLKGGDTRYSFRTYFNKLLYADDNEWVRYSLAFSITDGFDEMFVNVFSGGQTAYFDDLEIRRFSEAPKNDLPLTLRIDIPDSTEDLIQSNITDALHYEVIPTAYKEYVDAIIIEGKDSSKIELKLKGDWTDHLRSGKESYRVKIKGDLAFSGLKSFSIQHPKTRNYLDEWVAHQMADREGILTTDYDFINVNINGVNRGVYALEEHFDKQLLESRNRREGPILKYDETGFWAAMKEFEGFDNIDQLPYYQQSDVSVFKANRTRKSESLSAQYTEGAKLMALFKSGHLELEDLFDIDQLARFYVLTELWAGAHALRWHNRRFYFNPVTQKLEHIAYDILPFNKGKYYVNNLAFRLSKNENLHEEVFDNAILYHEEFKAKYLYYLELKTRASYLDSVFMDIDLDLKRNLKAIQGENNGYHFNKEKYYANASYLRDRIPDLEKLWSKRVEEKRTVSDWVKKKEYKPRADHVFSKEISVNTYVTGTNGFYKVDLENYHVNPITIHGYQIKVNKKETVYLEEPITIDGYEQGPGSDSFYSAFIPKRIFYTVSNNPGIIVGKKVNIWPKPTGNTTRMSLKENFDLTDFQLMSDGKTIVFEGEVIINELQYIPKNYDVKMMPGARIRFEKGAGLIICGSLDASGTAEQPIVIEGADADNNGLVILDAKFAKLNFVTCDGLSNLDHGKWQLTGALSVYQTPTWIDHLTVKNNHSEDAINLIRCSFKASHLNVSNTYSDGIDLDFCRGKMTGVVIENTGNDAIDLSGSYVVLTKVKVNQSGDKGISGGERSTISLNDIQINNAITGVVSKDASVIYGENIRVQYVQFGTGAFCKKTEYGPAIMDLSNYELTDQKRDFLLDNGSIILVNGQEEIGQSKLNIDSLYAPFEK